MPLKAIAAFLFVCLPAFEIRADGNGGEARLTSARVVEVTPGKIVTASILVANRSDNEAIYEETFDLPAGWQRISPPATPVTLSAREQQLRLIGFAVPGASPAGSFDFNYVLTNSRTGSPIAAVTVTVVVLPVVKLELIREDQTDVVIAGDTYEGRMRIINRGNSNLQVSVGAVSAPASPVALDATEVWVEASSSQVVRALVKTDVELRQPITQVVNFKISATGSDGTTVFAARSAVVKVIPRVTGDRDPYVRLPVQLRMLTVSEDGRVGAQAEFSGSGHLDEARQHRLEFLFRGPSLENKSLYGLRDEHRVAYYGPKLDVHLGDGNYSLSPLTQRFSYGRGASVNFHPAAATAGVFYMETRERLRNFQTTGLYLRRQFTPAFSLQANALHKSDSGRAQQTGPLSLFSLQPHFDFGERLNLELEYAMSTGATGTAAQAHRVHARGELSGGVVYVVERIRAGDKFFGYYHGTQSTQATVTFPIHGPLRGKASFNQEARDAAEEVPNERPLPTGVLATRQTAYRPGVLFRVSPRTDLSLEYQNIQRHTTTQAGPQNALEHSARLGMGHSRGKFSLQTYAEFGITDKAGSGASHGRDAVERYSAFVSYRPTARQAYSVYGTLGSSATLESAERSQELGASAQWNVSNRLSAGLNYARNEYDSRIARVQDTATGTVSYTLPNRNVVTVQSRWIKDSTTRQSSASMMVSYTIPLGVRASKKKSGGVIRGKIVEIEGDRFVPMSRVVVTANGITAVTDRNGQFLFPALAPGLYQVNIEQRSLGVDRVTLESIPMAVDVGKGEVAELAIGIVRSARVSVRVAVFASAQRNLMPGSRSSGEETFEEVGGLSAGLVELSNGNQILRQVTDRDGVVSFEHLRPGRWTLRVYRNNLPERHEIETPEIEFDLEPGQSREALVRVIPKFRPIRFIDGGSIVSQPRR